MFLYWIPCWCFVFPSTPLYHVENMSYQQEHDAEQKIKQCVHTYLKNNQLVDKDENVYFAEKAFKINGIVRWCIKRKLQRTISDATMDKHYEAINRFIKGEIELEWHPNGYLEIQWKK